MTSWIGCNIEQLFKLAQDRERSCESSFNTARAAKIKYGDAVTDVMSILIAIIILNIEMLYFLLPTCFSFFIFVAIIFLYLI